MSPESRHSHCLTMSLWVLCLFVCFSLKDRLLIYYDFLFLCVFCVNACVSALVCISCAFSLDFCLLVYIFPIVVSLFLFYLILVY